MAREQLGLKFPEGTRSRIQALARPDETMTAIILRAITLLEGGDLDGDLALSSNRPDSDPKGPARDEFDALTVRVAALESLLGRPAPSPDRKALMERIRQMYEAGLSHAKIASVLQGDGTPTLSGRGRWSQGQIGRLLQRMRETESRKAVIPVTGFPVAGRPGHRGVDREEV